MLPRFPIGSINNCEFEDKFSFCQVQYGNFYKAEEITFQISRTAQVLFWHYTCILALHLYFGITRAFWHYTCILALHVYFVTNIYYMLRLLCAGTSYS